MTRSTARGMLRGSRRVQCHGCGKQLLELRLFMIHGVGMIVGDVLGSCPSETSRNLPRNNFRQGTVSFSFWGFAGMIPCSMGKHVFNITKSRSPWLGEGLWAQSHFGQHGTSALLPMPQWKYWTLNLDMTWLTPAKGWQKFNHPLSFCSVCSRKTLPTSADLYRRHQDGQSQLANFMEVGIFICPSHFQRAPSFTYFWAFHLLERSELSSPGWIFPSPSRQS